MTEHLFAAPHATPEAPPTEPRQRTLDDLGTPLHEVTFVVFDIETTGGKAADGGITEIGAVKLRGGDCLGTYQTCLLYTSPSPRDKRQSRMPSSA